MNKRGEGHRAGPVEHAPGPQQERDSVADIEVTALLPCPFCGQVPTESPSGDGTGSMIECFTPGCVSPHVSYYGDGEAARRWNTRTTSSLQAAQIARLTEANTTLRNGYADAEAGLQYVIQHHGRLSGVGFDRVFDHFFQWVTMPEREGLMAGSHEIAALTKVSSHVG